MEGSQQRRKAKTKAKAKKSGKAKRSQAASASHQGNRTSTCGSRSNPGGSPTQTSASHTKLAFVCSRTNPDGSYIQVKVNGKLKHVICILASKHTEHRAIMDALAEKIDAREVDPWQDVWGVTGAKDRLCTEWDQTHE